MNLNLTTPFYSSLSDQEKIEMWSNIKTLLRYRTEKYLSNGTEETKLREIGRYFFMAVYSVVFSGIGTCTMKMIYSKMFQIIDNIKGSNLTPTASIIIENEFNWMTNIPINLIATVKLSQAVQIDENIRGSEREDMDIFILLNAVTQVVLSAGGNLNEHVNLTVMFVFVVCGHFMDLHDDTIRRDNQRILDLISNNSDAASPASSDPSSNSPNQEASIARTRFTWAEKAIMDQIFHENGGFIPPEDLARLVRIYQLPERSVKTYFKNKRAKEKRVSRVMRQNQ